MKPVEYEFQYAMEDFIDIFSNNTINDISDDEQERLDLCGRLVYKVFDEAEKELRDFVQCVRYRLHDELSFHKDKIAEDLSDLFSNRFWHKFQDGHDIEQDQLMICYFLETKKYKIGKAVLCENPKSGITFKFDDGTVADPDYVGFLPVFSKMMK